MLLMMMTMMMRLSRNNNNYKGDNHQQETNQDFEFPVSVSRSDSRHEPLVTGAIVGIFHRTEWNGRVNLHGVKCRVLVYLLCLERMDRGNRESL